AARGRAEAADRLGHVTDGAHVEARLEQVADRHRADQQRHLDLRCYGADLDVRGDEFAEVVGGRIDVTPDNVGPVVPFDNVVADPAADQVVAFVAENAVA